jgi:diaminopimelate decarboxylase
MTMSYSLARLRPDTATFSPEGILHIANHSIQQLVQEFGTPLYIFIHMDTIG